MTAALASSGREGRPRVGGRVCGPKPRGRDVGVYLGRGQTLVTQQFLDDAQIGPTVEQVGGETVAEGVGRDTLGQPGGHPQPLHTEPQAADCKG